MVEITKEEVNKTKNDVNETKNYPGASVEFGDNTHLGAHIKLKNGNQVNGHIGDNHITAENSEIHFNNNYKSSSVNYPVHYESTSVFDKTYFLVEKFGEKNISLGGTISFLASIVSLIASMKAILSDANPPGHTDSITIIYSYIPTIPPTICLFLFFFFLMLCFFLSRLAEYSESRRCRKCGKSNAYREVGKPRSSDFSHNNKIRIQTIRHFKCKYCGDTRPREDWHFDHRWI